MAHDINVPNNTIGQNIIITPMKYIGVMINVDINRIILGAFIYSEKAAGKNNPQ